MTQDTYAELPYKTPGCVLPSPLAILGGCYISHGIENHGNRYRCLDIGCGTGHSLIRLAQDCPTIEFVGIDLSSEQIRLAHEEVNKYDLQNIEFQALDFLDFNPDDFFDVVYCYGVLSWCPQELWKPLLQKIRKILHPTGIALISFNVYPGWYFKGFLRDVMMQEIQRSQPPAQQVQTAKSFTRFFINSLPESSPYRFILQQNFRDIEGQDDTYLFHEYLEDHNHAFRFKEFVRLCSDYGLQFISEFPFARSRISHLNPGNKFVPYLRKCLSHDRLCFEEALDLVIWRAFRRSLVCRSEVKMRGEDVQRFRSCRFRLGPVTFTSQAKAEDIQPGHVLEATAPYGGKRTLESPYELASLFLIQEEIGYNSLWKSVQKVPAVNALNDRLSEEDFLESLLNLMIHGFIIPIIPPKT